MRRSWAVVAVVGIAAGLLAGCAEAEPPTPSITTVTATPEDVPTQPSESPPLTPGSFPTPTAAPVMPPEASEISPEGAQAFVRYWLQTYNWMLASGDAAPFLRSSAGQCTFCREVSSKIVDRRAAGETMTGGMLSVRSTEMSGDIVEGHAYVVVDFDEESAVRKLPDGTVVNNPSAQGPRIFSISADAEGWMVVEVASP